MAALVSGSIGIAIYPNDAIDRESLMSHADTALYRAKVEGRGTYRFFETAMGAEVKERRHHRARSAACDLARTNCVSPISLRSS